MIEKLLSTSPFRFESQSDATRFQCLRAFTFPIILIGICIQSGCVALNIPSQRHHDPNDGGGILGSWEDPARPGRVLKEILVGPPPEAGLDACDDFGSSDPNFGAADHGSSAPPKPEVPWPQYHPIPTRPVFGG